MALHHYDKDGNLIGTTKTETEVQNEQTNALLGALILGLFYLVAKTFQWVFWKKTPSEMVLRLFVIGTVVFLGYFWLGDGRQLFMPAQAKPANSSVISAYAPSRQASEPTAPPSDSRAAYREYRKWLISQGFRPFQTLSDAQAKNESGNGESFWAAGYTEMTSCSGTGSAQCLLLWKNPEGMFLVVETVGEDDERRPAKVQSSRLMDAASLKAEYGIAAFSPKLR